MFLLPIFTVRFTFPQTLLYDFGHDVQAHSVNSFSISMRLSLKCATKYTDCESLVKVTTLHKEDFSFHIYLFVFVLYYRL